MKKSITFFSSSFWETKKIAEKFAQEILKKKRGPLFLILKGPLGAGKTFFLKFLAKSLGVKERIVSPSFVIFRKFKIRKKQSFFRFFYHFDLYRIKNFPELKKLGFEEISRFGQNIIAIEWGEKIKRNLLKLKKECYLISFQILSLKKRKIQISKLFC